MKDEIGSIFAKLTAEGDRKGYPPFNWQRRLLVDWLLKSEIPDALDIPTGLGKTSVMALWLMALAKGASLPRRLVYVVDRRAVVDQATDAAVALAKNAGEIPAIADGLGLGELPLAISTLRGAFADRGEWLEDPARPAIVVGTVDMIGSRVLFEGYGVSRRMRPFQAGLLGSDTLVVLDESHLCRPFEALLQRIVSQQRGTFGSEGAFAPPPIRLMSLSATGRLRPGMRCFQLIKEDWAESTVNDRVFAAKHLELIQLPDSKGLTAKLANRALALAPSEQPSRVLVYCDRRRDAVAVKQLIDKALKPSKRAAPRLGETELLVGERRVYERQELAEWLQSQGFLSGATAPTKPVFLVATSAGEVGIDLDADHMVCDLVSYERMVQRLGRVNRLGGSRNGVERQAVVKLLVAPPVRPSERASASKTQEYLEAYARFEARLRVVQALPRGTQGQYDVCPGAVMKLRASSPELVEQATTPSARYPAITRALIDAWAMTSLPEHAGRPEVAPWLRGWERDEEPQTTVVWRTHLPTVQRDIVQDAPSTFVAEYFQIAPIHVTEKLEAPRSHVLDWLYKRTNHLLKRRVAEPEIPDGDIVAIVVDHAGELAETMTWGQIKALALPPSNAPPTQAQDRRDWERILANRHLVLDARLGGLEDGMLAEVTTKTPPTADASEPWRDNYGLPFWVEKVGKAAGGLLELAQRPAPNWHPLRVIETEFGRDGAPTARLAVYKRANSSTSEESRAVVSIPQRLADHEAQVAKHAKALARQLGLPTDEVEALELAGKLHDEGKREQRWQDAMNADIDGRPYAKTRGGGDWRHLEGYRHEFGSLLLAEKESELPVQTRDLILHLVAAHHGRSRPSISPTGCEIGPPSQLETKAAEAAMRFTKLQRQYGPWGLAWREAILRAADQRASKEWQRQAATKEGR